MGRYKDKGLNINIFGRYMDINKEELVESGYRVLRDKALQSPNK